MAKDIDIKKIIENTNFSNLQKLEQNDGFNEASKYSNFFRSGKQHQWKNILNKNQIKLIETKLGQIMKNFNYI